MEEQSVHSSISDINSEEAVRSERKSVDIISLISLLRIYLRRSIDAYTLGTSAD